MWKGSDARSRLLRERFAEVFVARVRLDRDSSGCRRCFCMRGVVVVWEEWTL